MYSWLAFAVSCCGAHLTASKITRECALAYWQFGCQVGLLNQLQLDQITGLVLTSLWEDLQKITL